MDFGRLRETQMDEHDPKKDYNPWNNPNKCSHRKHGGLKNLKDLILSGLTEISLHMYQGDVEDFLVYLIGNKSLSCLPT